MAEIDEIPKRRRPALSRPDMNAAMEPPSHDLLRDPLAFIAAEHGGQRALCSVMEDLAGMPAFDRHLAVAILRYLKNDLVRHLMDEELDLFPLMRQRCLHEDEIDRILDRLNAEHKDEHRLAGELEAALETHLESTDRDLTPEVRACLFQYARSLRRHVALENSIILPLARARLTQDDLVTLSAAMVRRQADWSIGK
jgi:hemerythrin-like domain-containing protein